MKRSLMTKVLGTVLVIILLVPSVAFASTCDCDKPGTAPGQPHSDYCDEAKDPAPVPGQPCTCDCDGPKDPAAAAAKRERERAKDAAERERERAEDAAEDARDAEEEALEKAYEAKKYRDGKKDKAKGRPDWAGKDNDDDYVVVPPVAGLPGDGSSDTTPSADTTPVVGPEKLTGIANALSRIQRNIERAEAKVAAGQKEQVPPGLLRVLEKFMAWLGLAPVDPVPPVDPVDPTPDPSEEPTPPVTPPAPAPLATTVSAILAAPVVGQNVILTGEIVSMPAYDDLMLNDGSGTIFIDGDSDFGTFAVGNRVQVTGWVYFEDLLGRWEIQATGVQLQ